MNWQDKRDNWQPSERYLKREENRLKEKMISKIPSSYKSWWSYLNERQRDLVFRRYSGLQGKKIFNNKSFWDWCHSDIQPDKFEVRKKRISNIYDE